MQPERGLLYRIEPVPVSRARWLVLIAAALVALFVTPVTILLAAKLFAIGWASYVPIVLGAALVSYVAAYLLINRYPRWHHGVSFFEDELVLGGDAESIPWARVVSYDDGSADLVKVRYTLGWGAKIAEATGEIPTRTEAGRVAVLELLDRKGVPRAE